MRSLNASMKCALALAVIFTATGNAQAKSKAAKSVAPAPVAAPSSPATPAAPTKDEKVDVSDLENKYWAPKDTDFSVVQNRTYAKENRYFATLHYGPLVNDKYSEGNNLGVSANYFWSERFGVQLSYLNADLKNSEVVSSLQTQFATGVLPNFGRMTSYKGIGFNWVPFYAKMSFMGKKIIYFDMAVTPTLGMTDYDQQVSTGNKSKSALTYGFDVTQYFFFSNHFAIRADLKNQWFTEERLKYYSSTPSEIGAKINDQLNHTTIFMLGLTIFY